MQGTTNSTSNPVQPPAELSDADLECVATGKVDGTFRFRLFDKGGNTGGSGSSGRRG